METVDTGEAERGWMVVLLLSGQPAVEYCPRSGQHRPPCPAGGGRCGELSTDVGWQAAEEQQQEHGVWMIARRQQRQQLIHQGGGTHTSNMGKCQELLGKLPVGGCIGFQQVVFCQLIWIGCGVSQAVHNVADVVKDVSGQLGKSVVPLVLRRNNVGPPEDCIRMLKLDRNVRARGVERPGNRGGGGSVRITRNLCC